MTITLCEVGAVRARLEHTPLANSPIWQMPIETLGPMHLHAYVTRRSLEGAESEGVAEIEVVLAELGKAHAAGQIVRARALDYKRPTHRVLTVTTFKNGLARLTREKAQAVLFGLELALPIEDVISLQWPAVLELRGKLTTTARLVLKMQPRHLRCQYVFWHEYQGEAWPCFGLDQAVFDAFGMVWAELGHAYKNMLLIDYDQELKRWQELLPQ